MRIFLFFLVFCISLSLTACGEHSEGMETERILTSLMEAQESFPGGVTFRHTATEGMEDYLPPSAREAMYGADSERYFKLIEQYSIYMSSFAAPYEIGVFKCYSKSDGLKIEAMCRTRWDIVSVALRETEFYGLCDDIRVLRKGDTVVFIMVDNADKCARLAKKLI